MPFQYPSTKWVRLKRAAELSGYTEKALRDKISKGQLEAGRVWRNAPDNRVIINIAEFDAWLESAPQKC